MNQVALEGLGKLNWIVRTQFQYPDRDKAAIFLRLENLLAPLRFLWHLIRKVLCNGGWDVRNVFPSEQVPLLDSNQLYLIDFLPTWFCWGCHRGLEACPKVFSLPVICWVSWNIFMHSKADFCLFFESWAVERGFSIVCTFVWLSPSLSSLDAGCVQLRYPWNSIYTLTLISRGYIVRIIFWFRLTALCKWGGHDKTVGN